MEDTVQRGQRGQTSPPKTNNFPINDRGSRGLLLQSHRCSVVIVAVTSLPELVYYFEKARRGRVEKQDRRGSLANERRKSRIKNLTMINAALTAFNSGFRLLRAHVWTIGLVVLAAYVLKGQLLKLKSHFFEGKSIGVATSSSSSNREEEMRKARERQQELLNERAKIAAAERQKKEKEERQKKAEEAKEQRKKEREKELGRGRRLGDSGDSSDSAAGGGGGYNPMQPWSAGTGGGGYRAQRRQVNRG